MTEVITERADWIDRSSWGPGPWDDEPDRIVWEHEGFPCLVQRSHLGHLCGYVGVSKGHPWFGIDVFADGAPDVDAHGGLTYGGNSSDGLLEPAISRAIGLDNVYWVGFDCAHFMDLVPAVAAFDERLFGRLGPVDHNSYKTIGYVRSEVISLAEAAKTATLEGPP